MTMMRRRGMTACAAGVTALGVLTVGSVSPAAAVECSRYVVSADPGLVTAAEYDQLSDGMTLEQVQALFGSPGAQTHAFETSLGKYMTLEWNGAVSRLDWYGGTTTPEISVDFSMTKATTETVYKRKKVRVKNLKRAKRLGLKKWRWKRVKVVKQIPATPYTVDYFSLYDAEVLRQTAPLSCSTY
ncbi:MAG: hypothetical protein R2703_16645 [Micropruina glycogenica]|nr:hypothetical protein [Actinomycetota bacterium]